MNYRKMKKVLKEKGIWFIAYYFEGEGSGKTEGDPVPGVSGQYTTVRYGQLERFTIGASEGTEFNREGKTWVVIKSIFLRGDAGDTDEHYFIAIPKEWLPRWRQEEELDLLRGETS